MEIELEKTDDEIKVLEYVIRNQSFNEGGEKITSISFQARIDTPNLTEDDSVHGSFSYYDKDGKFLGVNADSVWAGDFMSYKPYPVSFELNLPHDTQLVKCQLVTKLHNKSIWDYGWKIFAVLVYVLLISAIVSLWV